MRLFPERFGVRLLLGPLLALGLLGGCNGGAEQKVIAGDPVPRQGSVRIVNAVPDAPRITGVLSGINLGAHDFAQASELGKFLVGIYNLRVLYATPDGDFIDVAPAERVELTQEKEFSFFVTGSWAAPTLVRVDNVEIDFGVDFTKTDHLEKADVQVVHASADAGPVDVYLTESGADLGTETPLASIAYGNAGALETVTPQSNYQLRVTTAGTTDVLYDSGEFAIEGFTRQMFLIRDYFGPGGYDFTVSRVVPLGIVGFPNDTRENELMFANYIADAPSVDVYFGDTATPPVYDPDPVFAGVAFGERTLRSLQNPGPRSVKVTLAGTSTVVLEDTTTVVPGAYQTLFAGGLDAGDTTDLVSAVDDIRTVATEARVRVDHASRAAGTVDVFILPPGQPTGDTAPTFDAFPVNARGVDFLLPGSYDVTIVRNSNPAITVAGPERISVDIGGLYTLALTDSPGGGEPVLLLRQDDLAP